MPRVSSYFLNTHCNSRCYLTEMLDLTAKADINLGKCLDMWQHNKIIFTYLIRTKVDNGLINEKGFKENRMYNGRSFKFEEVLGCIDKERIKEI